MKNGANKVDQIKIKEFEANGVDAEEISQRLRIKIECVKAFMKPVKKTRAKKVKVEE